MNSGNETNRKGVYRIDEMFCELYETETMNREDGSELVQEGLTDDEKARILGIVVRKMEDGMIVPERAAGWSRVLKRRVLLASLIAVLTFATTAFAAELFQWDARLSNYFGIEDHNQQDISGGGMNIGVSAETGGVTIEAVQTIGDGNNLYILLDVTAPSGQRIYPQSSFDMIYLQVDGATSMGYSCDMLEEDDENDNKATFLFAMEANKKINNKMINLSFSNLRHYIPGSGEMLIDTEGEWELEWKLDYEDIARTFKINKEIEVKGRTVKVDTISISPIALNVQISGSYIEEYDSAPPEPGEEELIQITAIMLKDGSILNREDAFSWGTSIRGREAVLNMQMKKLLNVDQVESITLNDTEFKIPNE